MMNINFIKSSYTTLYLISNPRVGRNNKRWDYMIRFKIDEQDLIRYKKE